MSKCKISWSRTLQHTLRLLRMYDHNDGEAKVKLEDLQNLTIRGIFSKFPMPMVRPTLDVYGTPQAKQIHDLSQRISPLLKECTSNPLDHKTCLTKTSKSRNKKTAAQNPRKEWFWGLATYFYKNWSILRLGKPWTLISWKGRADKSRPASSIGQVSYTCWKLGALIRLICMLSPPMGAVLESLSRLYHSPITLSYVWYVEVIHVIYQLW